MTTTDYEAVPAVERDDAAPHLGTVVMKFGGTSVADPEKLNPGFNLTPYGMYLRTPIEGHLGLMDFDGGAFDRSQPLTRDHLQEVLRRISGTDVTLDEVHQAASFTDRAMQTTTYRRGRVLVAAEVGRTRRRHG